MNTQSTLYQQAALAYLIYGIIYLVTAIYQLTPVRQHNYFAHSIPWWGFYILGAVVLVLFPILIWKQYKWFTRILALGPAGKALTLVLKEYKNYGITGLNYFSCVLALAAIVATVFLVRASWLLKRSSSN